MKRSASHFSIAAALALPFVVLGAPAAVAQEYTIIVPVAVSDMPPELREIEVGCGVSGASAPGRSRDNLGGGSVRRPLTAGAFNGEVTVSFNRTPLAGSRVPTHWNCYLRAHGTISGAPAEFWSYDDPTTRQYGLKTPPDRSPRLEIPAAAGAPKVVSISGEIPAASAGANPAPGKTPQQPGKPEPNKPKPK